MFQRIQSLYLIVLVIINVLALAMIPLWKIGVEAFVYLNDIKVLAFLIALIIGASLASLLQYKARQRQMAVNRILLLINLIFMGFVLFHTYMPESGFVDAIKEGELALDNGGFLPMVNIVLLFLANKGIRKDEELVKSIDRIR